MPKPGYQALAASLCAAVLLLAAPAATAQGFFSNIEDLPVMPGLAEMPGTALAFDKPGGRIAEVGATGGMEREDVLSFYRRTLPQLGWKEIAPGRFAREGERLRLDFDRGGGRLTVRFSIFPG